jgi:hypothetical protein
VRFTFEMILICYADQKGPIFATDTHLLVELCKATINEDELVGTDNLTRFQLIADCEGIPESKWVGSTFTVNKRTHLEHGIHQCWMEDIVGGV